MAQFFHCIVFLVILFFLAEIRDVLMNSDPVPQPLTIWEEVRKPRTKGMRNED